MAYAPLAIGLLSGAYRPGGPLSAETLWACNGRASLEAALKGRPGDVVRAVFAVAERTGAIVAQVALRWVMAHPEISVVITGAHAAEQLDDIVGAVGLRVADADIDELNRASEGLGLVGW